MVNQPDDQVNNHEVVTPLVWNGLRKGAVTSIHRVRGLESASIPFDGMIDLDLAEFGLLRESFPRWMWPLGPTSCPSEIASWIKSREIRFRKRRRLA